MCRLDISDLVSDFQFLRQAQIVQPCPNCAVRSEWLADATRRVLCIPRAHLRCDAARESPY